MSSFCDMTATHLRQMIGRKDISPVELVEASIERIEMVDPSLNAFVTKNYEAARKTAKIAEKNVLEGELLGLLHQGINVIIFVVELIHHFNLWNDPPFRYD